jgi:serine/threonine protein kinase
VVNIYADQVDVLRSERYVVLKIVMADVSKTSHELKIHQLLAKVAGDRASDRIVQLLDHFKHTGPNGTHLCLVFEPLGTNIHEMKYDLLFMPELQKYGKELMRKYPVPIGKMILRQILEALDLLHQNGIAHGNLGAENIQFVPAKLEHCPEKEIRQFFGEGASEVFPVCRKDGKIDKWAPRYQVQADPLDDLEVDTSFKVKLSDVGWG